MIVVGKKCTPRGKKTRTDKTKTSCCFCFQKAGHHNMYEVNIFMKLKRYDKKGVKNQQFKMYKGRRQGPSAPHTHRELVQPAAEPPLLSKATEEAREQASLTV